MKIAVYQAEDGDRIALVVEGGLVTLVDHLPRAPRSMPELITAWAEWKGPVASLSGVEPDRKLDEVRLLAPVPRPGKIMAIGLNYKDHIAETGLPTPTNQIWFSKAGTSVAGPQDPIALPAVSAALDYEAELVAIIGTRARGVTRQEAPAVIFGYCVGNDVSVRDWQTRSPQWVIGKSFDTHAPFGPWITTADETDARDLDIRAFVNGEARQASNTSHLLFDVYAQIEELSAAMTLEPGDVIYTGTPGGVGMGFQPPRWLKAGDTVRVEIDGLGAIENRVMAEPRQGFSMSKS